MIEGGRFVPTGLVRVVDYPDPYPIRNTKVVEVVNVGNVGNVGNVENMSEPSQTVALRSDQAVGDVA